MQSKRLAKSKISQDDVGILFLIAAIFFGAWFRYYAVSSSGFPINDGGLFLTMTQALQDNAYHLPKFIQYNGLEIPFAYPPLAFYITGIAQNIFNIPLIDMFRWLPAIVTTLTIPAIYWLTKSMVGSPLQAGVASFLYAMLPRTITWLIMGGGITRSLGQLFLILTLTQVNNLFNFGSKKYLIFASFFSALVCLTHPEATIHTIGFILLLFAFTGRSIKNLPNAIAIATSTMILTSPWWITVLTRFGIYPYLAASQTGFHSSLFYLYAVIFPFSEEPFVTLTIVLAILGLAVNIAKMKFLLPVMYFLPFILEPRNGANVATIPMAILASAAINEMIFPALANIEGKIRDIKFNSFLQSRSEKFLLAYICFILFASMQHYSLELSKARVTDENIQAYAWIKTNTPSDSRFIVITGSADLFSDSTLEWFPALTNRISITTIQGREWLYGDSFAERIENIQELQRCVVTYAPLECVETKAASLASGYEYILIVKEDKLIAELLNDNENYEVAYQKQDVAIFATK